MLPEISFKMPSSVKGFNASLSYLLHSLAKFSVLCNGREQQSSIINKEVDSILCNIEEQLKGKWIKRLIVPTFGYCSRDLNILPCLSVSYILLYFRSNNPSI